ncbi:homeodomain-interacting protein kinase 2-like [Takifugu flavidus]|uniref:homeodomain-interacting protein kinase 2-like n=1 Tax=Takifugu flavidus TaxID=433684 RepID=UPI0025449E2F|nr:homeodomain-interacting protein kinase 2-like [Takifugu flavidus]
MAHGYQHWCPYPSAYEHNIVEIGSILFSRQTNYLVLSILGEGTFGKVVKCIRLKDNKTVAVKVIKKEEDYYDCVEDEIQALLKLKNLDPEICNVVQIHAAFFDRGYFCFVFEYLDKSLFDYMVENDFRPLPLEGIRLIVQQLAVALQSLRSVGLTHCDIKLDNIMLVDHEKQPFRIKLIDFGLADVASSIPQGSVIQALSYRSPEVLLGLPLTEAVDMWSLGCVVGELHLGDRLFDGNNEYDMMRSIVELLGQPPNRMLDAGIKTNQYFKKSLCPWNRSWKLKTQLRTAGDKLLDSLDDLLSAFRTKGCENPDLSLLVDLLKKMLDLDPATRITPAQLLQHGFLTNTEVGTTCKEPEVTASKENGQSLQSQCESTQHNQASQLKTGQKRKHDYKDDDPTCHDSKRPKIQSKVTPREDTQMNAVNSTVHCSRAA